MLRNDKTQIYLLIYIYVCLYNWKPSTFLIVTIYGFEKQANGCFQSFFIHERQSQGELRFR